MHDDHRYDGAGDASRWGGMSTMSVVLPFAATIVSLVFGMFIGGAAVWIARPSHRPIDYMQTASLAELQLVCEPVVEETKNQLTRIKGEIADLKDEVRQKEAIVAELREQVGAREADESKGRVLASKLRQAREELAEARLELKMLREVKDQLVDQLTATQQRLDKTESDLQAQVAITDALRTDNLELKSDMVVHRWFRMITEAQLDICEKGSRRRTEACRESVVSALSDIRREFVHCVRSEQAAPTVEELPRDAPLPQFARMLQSDDRRLQGFYVQLCDPTLPEAPVLEASALGG